MYNGTASICTKKIILFLLQRGSKAFNLNLAGLFLGLMESATSVKEYTVY